VILILEKKAVVLAGKYFSAPIYLLRFKYKRISAYLGNAFKIPAVKYITAEIFGNDSNKSKFGSRIIGYWMV
jgi:hypothetical protein